MPDWWISAVIGLALVTAAGFMMYGHRKIYLQQKHDLSIEAFDKQHFARRYRRRMQTSFLLGLLGVLIFVGDALPAIRNSPAIFGIYWIGVVLLTCWVALLGLGDLASVRSHGTASAARLRQRQRELEGQIAQLRRHREDHRDREEPSH